MIKYNHRESYKLMWFIPFIFYLFSCNATDNHRELIPVTVGITSFIGEAASFVAVEKEFFRDNGLKVTLQVNSDGSESVRQLLAGEVDIAHIAETPILYSVLDSTYFTGESQGNLQIVANMIFSNKIQKVMGRRDAGIEAPRDIIGKRVAFTKGTQLEYLLDSFLLEYQVPIGQIDTVHMQVFNQVEAITNGEIDVAVAWEPQATQIEFLLGENAIELPTKLTYSHLWLITVLDHYANDNPEVIRAYLKSLLQAQQYIQQNPEWSLNLLAEQTAVPIDVIRKAVSQIDYELSLTERMLNLLKEQKQWMIKNGLADQSDVEIFDMINFRFMEEVYPEGITLIR